MMVLKHSTSSKQQHHYHYQIVFHVPSDYDPDEIITIEKTASVDEMRTNKILQSAMQYS